MSCHIDWRLVLEFVKALAAPAATLGSVWLVARFGLRAYSTQKAFDRRLDWYERAFRQIGIASDHYAQVEGAIRAGDQATAKAQITKGGAAADTLLSYCQEALLYAPLSGYKATARLTSRLLEVNLTVAKAGGWTADHARDAVLALAEAATSLSGDVRREMGLPSLPVVRVSTTQEGD